MSLRSYLLQQTKAVFSQYVSFGEARTMLYERYPRRLFRQPLSSIRQVLKNRFANVLLSGQFANV